MKNIFTFCSEISFTKIMFRTAFLLMLSISFQNVNAQCSPDISAPLPDNPNLPDITGECSVLLTRPTAYDLCENRAVSGTVANNQLVYSVGSYTVTWTYTDGSSNTVTQTQKVIVSPLSPPVITADGPTTFCTGDSVTLTSNKTTGNVWTGGTTNTTSSIKIKTANTYTLSYTESGCTSKATQKVTVDTAPPPVPTITARSSTTFCSGLSVVLKSSSTTGNTWTGGTTIDSLRVFTSGTYSVTVTNGCGSKTSLGKVIIAKPLTASITVSGSTSICLGESVTMVSNSPTGNTWTGGSTNDSLTVSPTTTATYTLTMTNGCGPATKATKKVTLKPQPATPFLTPLGTVCSNDTPALPFGFPLGGTYSGPGVISIPPLISIYSPALASSSLGGGTPTITYTVTDTLTGCSSATTQTVTIDTSANCSTGIEENNNSMDVTVYPNPTNGLLNLVVKNSNSNQLLIRIFDVLGNEVFSASDNKNSTDHNKQISLEGLANGIYTIQLSAGADVVTRKLIVQ